MNCTEQEFIDRVRAKYPHKWFNREFTTNGNYCLMLDTLAETNLDFQSRLRLASHIWLDGSVIRDSDGIFSSNTILSIAKTTHPLWVTLNGVPISGLDNFNIAINSNLQSPKCECGAHATGSNRHSSWCQIKDVG